MSTLRLQIFTRFDENIRPPEYKHDLKKGYILLPKGQVISWIDGVVLSYYGDDIWDLTPYSKKKNTITFSQIQSDKLKEEAKRLLYLYMIYGDGRGKTVPSGMTIRCKFLMIKSLCDYAYNKGKSLDDIFSDKRLLRYYIVKIGHISPNQSSLLKTILELLERLSLGRTGFRYESNKSNKKLLMSITRRYHDSLNQTLLIPVTIYASAAKNRWDHISIIEKNLKMFVQFLSQFIQHKGFALGNTRSLTEEEIIHSCTWNTAVKKYKLEKIFDQYDVTSRVNIPSFITNIQATCRHLIHQYTGMRENECRMLLHHCWQEKTSHMPSRIFGYESKVHGLKTPQVWITHDNIKRVIDILNAIGKPMYEGYCSHLDVRPLMIRTGFMMQPLNARSINEAVPNSLSNINELPLDIEGIKITKEHIHEELMAIEPMRNWDEHAWIKEGEQWRFNSHQYRRSLAIYALGSGLVSLHAIKEQFGHIIIAMTAYYGNGYKSARRLDGSTDQNKHIANYMQSNKHIVEALSYQKNVLLSNSPLWGPNGLFLEKHVIAKTSIERQMVMQRTPQLIKQFKDGTLQYQETAMGGCTNSYECDKFLLPDFFTSCIGCNDSIHMLVKIERLAEKQHTNAIKWGQKSPDSINHRTAVKRSIAINEFRDMLRRKEEKLEKTP